MAPIQAKRSPFFAHVAELRKRLTVCVVVLLAATMVCYQHVVALFSLKLVFLKVAPYLPKGMLYTVGPFEAMGFRFQVAFFSAVVVCSPLIIYEFLAFFLPALRNKERKWLLPTFFAAILLFLAGFFFAYFVILGPAFKWLTEQAIGPVNLLPSASQYFSGIGLLLLGFGLSFEIPLAVFYLIGFGILKYHTVRDGWRYVYVGLFVLAAVATPDWSPWPMLSLSVALILLYEASLIVTRRIFHKRVWQQEVDAWEDFKLEFDPENDTPEYLKKYRKLKARATRAAEKLAAIPEKPDVEDDEEDEDV